MKNVFFVGINGIGMSGLAQILKTLDYNVSGSDLSKSYLSEKMKNQGINIFTGHSSENIDGMDTLVVSTAIGEDNPEYKRAVAEGLKIIKRGELLANLLNEKTGIAVAGTHGKTTTSSMLSTVLLGIDPTVMVGGIVPSIGSNARYGKSEYFVAEADESDNSFLYMKPKYSIVTNIEEDHLEKHGNLENIKSSFDTFIGQTSKEVLLCLDSPNIEEVLNKYKNIKTYSLENKDADIYADNIYIKEKITHFKVYINGEDKGEFSLTIPGTHNVYNSLPVIYLALKFRVPMNVIKERLLEFTGAKRRYDILLEDERFKIIDDYGHHPTEIVATLQGAKSIESKKITVIFQPHRYSRVKFLYDQFEGAFNNADRLFLMPVYSAGEENTFGVSLEDFLAKINHKNSKIIETEEEIEKEILLDAEESVYIFMGAGSISGIANNLAKKLRKQ